MKSERFELRLEEETIDRLDCWREAQPARPTRAEAVRRLINAGLAATGRPQIELSDGEKLIVSMLADMYKSPEERDLDPEFIREVIFGGHYWALEWKYSGIYHGHRDSYEVLSEVTDILEMWWFIEDSYSNLTEVEKKRIKDLNAPFSKNVSFIGFDGNYESQHRSMALFLMERLDRFTELHRGDLNSHFPVLDAYRGMLKAFYPVRKSLSPRNPMGVKKLMLILEAATHPERRAAS